jgi:predicted lipid-binding transport protein (Tim44 family)
LWTWWQRRNAPAYAAAGPSLRDTMGGLAGAPRPPVDLGGASPASQTGQPDEIGIQPADFDVFERLLGEIQTAYGREDLATLRARMTPEMLSYFSEDLAKNASRGVVNEVSDVKLLQGDLAEAWREGDVEYASVAMRFSLVDCTRERATSRVVEGGATPQEVTEVWTFMRSRGGAWLLSAIQQV